MATELSNMRRIEQLEQQLKQQERLIRSLLDRRDAGAGTRYFYQAKTIKIGETYPASGATFGLQFLDREFVRDEGQTTVTDHPRSDLSQAVGRTVNGQWVLEGEIVRVWPAKPPPGTTGKGSWWIDAQPYYYGKLTEALEPDSTAAMEIWTPGDGTPMWAASGHEITVRDWFLRFTTGITDMPIGTGVRADWVQDPTTPANSCFVVSEMSCSEVDAFD
jgi:hypothetical protein